MKEYPLKYDFGEATEKINTDGERFKGAWWRNNIKKGLEASPHVEKPSSNESEWLYTSDAVV